MKTSARYHFFTIWPNGFKHFDAILDDLRQHPDFEIILWEKRRVKSMRRFVFDLYGCDSVPITHLLGKLDYLFKLQPEIINIFVINHNPQEIISGTPPLRKKRCMTIVNFKEALRNRYNPRHPDPNFHRKPLNKGVSHDHVIHGSDREEQTDYYLKLLGRPEGVDYLAGNSENLLFKKPFHIPRPRSYSFRKLPIDNLRASIITDYPKKHLVHIKNTPHYLGLTQDSQLYIDYLNNVSSHPEKEDHNWRNLHRLDALDTTAIDQLPPILVTLLSNKQYRILDGVHRTAVQYHHGYSTINCVVFEE